jgi:hypothetical protein
MCAAIEHMSTTTRNHTRTAKGTDMPRTVTQRVATTPTERLAYAALELHRLAKTAAEIQHLPSPVAKREQTSKRGAQDPTATTALDEKRAAVADALANVSRDAAATLAVDIETMCATLTAALDAWDGRR